jgi:hypothetical protein
MSMEDFNFAKAREAWATPVKIVQYNCTCGKTMKFESEHGVIAPQRTWVGLKEEEIWSDGDSFVTSEVGIKQFARAIEAKLKEKNT